MALLRPRYGLYERPWITQRVCGKSSVEKGAAAALQFCADARDGLAMIDAAEFAVQCLSVVERLMMSEEAAERSRRGFEGCSKHFVAAIQYMQIPRLEDRETIEL